MAETAFVLDTHAWIWYVSGDAEIKASSRNYLETKFANNPVLIPAICVWEIALLSKRSRLHLAKPLADWVHEALSRPRFTLSPLDERIAMEAANLPPGFHNDPADCMIVATARVADATLVTRDKRIIDYAESGHVRVFAI